MRIGSEAYGWFPRSFDTLDLNEAKALLNVINVYAPHRSSCQSHWCDGLQPINQAVTIVRPHNWGCRKPRTARGLCPRSQRVLVSFQVALSFVGRLCGERFFLWPLCRLPDVRRTSVHVNPASIPGMFLSRLGELRRATLIRKCAAAMVRTPNRIAWRRLLRRDWTADDCGRDFRRP
jgi:hypothetical protein